MLNATKLREFLDAAKTAIPEIKQTIPVISDDDVALRTRDIKTSDNEVVLVGVLPSYGLNFRDSDNYYHNNKMMLFLVKKFDTRKGYDAFLNIYDETGPLVLKLEEWLFAEAEKFPCNPIFKQIDFRTFTPDPVRDYHGFYGYMINFDLNN